ncbi:MAG TPA: phosphotransferase [Firmicutes bacterium]|nr:phosphotransferase [Bacillota bacterium]
MPDEFKLSKDLTADLAFPELTGVLADIVPLLDDSYFSKARWFQHKHAAVARKRLRDIGEIRSGENIALPAIIDIDFKGYDSKGASKDGDTESYYMPFLLQARRQTGAGGFYSSQCAGALNSNPPKSEDMEVLFRLNGQGGAVAFYLYDGTASHVFLENIINMIKSSGDLQAMRGGFCFRHTGRGLAQWDGVTAACALPGEYSNSLVMVEDKAGHRAVLKIFRRLLPGISPELEILLKLQSETRFRAMPLVHGYMSYRDELRREHTICLVQEFLENAGDAWGLFRECVRRHSRIDEYVEALALLTADLHFALASLRGPGFAPERLTDSDLRDIPRRIGQMLDELRSALERGLARCSGDMRAMMDEVIAGGREIKTSIEGLISDAARMREGTGEGGGAGAKFRIHGDLHLGQFLWMGEGAGFAVIDFEGEPLRGIGQRRLKESPLRDVAGILRSFDYVAHSHLIDPSQPAGGPGLSLASAGWLKHAEELFIASYVRRTKELGGQYLPGSKRLFTSLLTIFKLEKAIYEALYEIGNRPGWLGIPLSGIVRILREL